MFEKGSATWDVETDTSIAARATRKIAAAVQVRKDVMGTLLDMGP